MSASAAIKDPRRYFEEVGGNAPVTRRPRRSASIWR